MRVNEVSSEHFKSWVTNMDPRACIIYSSDGLIFVTYDHYKTFYEII